MGVTLTDARNTARAESILDRIMQELELLASGTGLKVERKGISRELAFDTTALLAGSGEYTSDAVDGLNARRLTGIVHAAPEGSLYIEHSVDGTTWYSEPVISVASGTLVTFDKIIFSRYVRVRYVNSLTAQTSFRLTGYISAE